MKVQEKRKKAHERLHSQMVYDSSQVQKDMKVDLFNVFK